jgi:hypothetical protein
MKAVLQQTDPDIEAVRFKPDGTFEAVTEEKGPPKKKQSSNRSTSATIVSLSDESDEDNAPSTHRTAATSIPAQSSPPSDSDHASRPIFVPTSTASPPQPTTNNGWTNSAPQDFSSTSASALNEGYEPSPPSGSSRYAPSQPFMWNMNPTGETADEAICIDSDDD